MVPLLVCDDWWRRANSAVTCMCTLNPTALNGAVTYVCVLNPTALKRCRQIHMYVIMTSLKRVPFHIWKGEFTYGREGKPPCGLAYLNCNAGEIVKGNYLKTVWSNTTLLPIPSNGWSGPCKPYTYEGITFLGVSYLTGQGKKKIKWWQYRGVQCTCGKCHVRT